MLSLFIAFTMAQVPANGYDDYQLANADCKKPAFVAWLGYYQGRPQPDRPVPGLTAKSSKLEIYRWADKNLTKIVDLIKQGNQKPYRNPFDPDKATDPMALPIRYWNLVYLLRACAYARFAAGDSNAGTDDLIASLTLSRRIGSQGTLIDVITSNGYIRVTLAQLAARLKGLSVANLSQIEQASTSQEDGSFASILRTDALHSWKVLDLGFDAVDTHPEANKPPSDPDAEDLAVFRVMQSYTAMQPANKKRFRARLRQAVLDRCEPYIQSYRVAEASWPLTLPPYENAASRGDEDTLADYVVSMSSEIYPQVATSTFYMRVQLRLLAIHARIERYRWTHHRYPSTLEECGVSDRDPCNNLTYRYALEGKGFRLISQGRKETGEISLTSRLRSSDDESPTP